MFRWIARYASILLVICEGLFMAANLNSCFNVRTLIVFRIIQQIQVEIKTSMHGRKPPKKSYLLCHNKNELNSQPQTTGSSNIFKGAQRNSEYFATCPEQVNFLNRVRKYNNSEFSHVKTEAVVAKKQLTDRDFTQEEQLYKIDKVYSANHKLGLNVKSRSSQKYSMPQICPGRRQNSLEPSRKSSKASEPDPEAYWSAKVNKHLYQKSLIQEIAYNQPLEKRSGDKYFELLLRDRHKEDMKPLPYVYSIKGEVGNVGGKYLAEVRSSIPDIVAKKSIKLRGVAKLHPKIVDELA